MRRAAARPHTNLDAQAALERLPESLRTTVVLGVCQGLDYAEVARILKPDGSIYATQASDLYSLGVYLARHKYRYLRFSYLFFLMGFVLACGEQAVRLLLN